MFQPLTPNDFLMRAARFFPEKTAVVDEGKVFTYDQFGRRVHRLANALLSLGAVKGDRIAILSPNSHWMLESFYGVPLLGAILVPINYRLVADDFRYILEHSGSKILLLDWEYAAPLLSIRGGLRGLEKIILLRDQEPAPPELGAVDIEPLLVAASDEPPPDPGLDEKDICTLNYTSGTTARPKGVMLSHRALLCNALDYTIHFGVHYSDVYLHTLPMFHANGWGGVWSVTGMGGTHINLRKID
ncbi:MAG TPA: AMP-binding protein, partial [Tepidisphaeraceae bacterium]|nr:AMP-binding protein [Tepidisphaeraceae bacterium]